MAAKEDTLQTPSENLATTRPSQNARIKALRKHPTAGLELRGSLRGTIPPELAQLARLTTLVLESSAPTPRHPRVPMQGGRSGVPGLCGPLYLVEHEDTHAARTM